jgi:hypothetical protein
MIPSTRAALRSLRAGERARRRVLVFGALGLAVVSWPAVAQWQGLPTPGLPRKADGTFDASAAAPRAADGKPDLSGIWMAPRIRVDLAQGLKKGETVPFTSRRQTDLR